MLLVYQVFTYQLTSHSLANIQMTWVCISCYMWYSDILKSKWNDAYDDKITGKLKLTNHKLKLAFNRNFLVLFSSFLYTLIHALFFFLQKRITLILCSCIYMCFPFEKSLVIWTMITRYSIKGNLQILSNSRGGTLIMFIWWYAMYEVKTEGEDMSYPQPHKPSLR